MFWKDQCNSKPVERMLLKKWETNKNGYQEGIRDIVTS